MRKRKPKLTSETGSEADVPAPDANDAELNELAAKIREGMANQIKGYRTSREHALEVGSYLAQAKARYRERYGLGKWREWLLKNTKLSLRTCQLYMRLHMLITAMPEFKEKLFELDMPITTAVE